MLNQAAPEEAIELLCCKVGDETYCVDVESVRSIEPLDLLQGNPQVGALVGWLLGRDCEVPVFSLAVRLRTERREVTQASRVIVFDALPEPWGLLVDGIEGVQEVGVKNLFAPPHLPHTPAMNFFQGVVNLGDRLAFYLAPERVNTEADSYVKSQNGALHVRRSVVALPRKEVSGQLMFFHADKAEPGKRQLVFAVSLNRVRRIVDSFTLTKVPSAPPHILGIAQWVEGPVPVVDFCRCLGLEATKVDEDTCLLILRVDGGKSLVGVPTRADLRAVSLPLEHQPCARDLGVTQAFVRAAYELPRETLVVPDVDRLLAFDEAPPPKFAQGMAVFSA